MFDLGLDLNYFENLTAVTENIQFLEQRVMIMDYFDGSLVMMKRMLCRVMDDILYTWNLTSAKIEKRPLTCVQKLKKA